MPIPLIFRKLKPALHESVKIQSLPVADHLPPKIAVHFPAPKQAVLEVDVPGNGGCLFYAVIFGYLLPVAHDTTYEAFKERYRSLFGEEEQLFTPQALREFLRGYNGDPRFILDNIILKRSVNESLRARVVKHMQEKNFDIFKEIVADEANAASEAIKDQASVTEARNTTADNIQVLEEKKATLMFMKNQGYRTAKEVDKEVLEIDKELSAQNEALNHKKEEQSSRNLSPAEKEKQYYEDMQKVETFGGNNEIINLSKMLKVKIVIYKLNEDGGLNPFKVYGKKNLDSIYLVHVNEDHYHYLVTPESFYPNLYSAQQERKSRDRQRFALLAVVSSIVLPIISLVFLLPLWSRLKKNEMKNEKLKLLDTTEDVIKQVKERRNAWKAHILKREDNLHLGEANPHRKVERLPAEANLPANPQQKQFIVDEKKYERFTLFRDTPLETLQSDNTLEEKHRTSKKESTTILNEFKRPQ